MTTTRYFRTYSEMVKIKDYNDRLEYLKVTAPIGSETFGGYRYLNQRFYRSEKWKRTRRNIILRDNGCDLAHEDYPISDFDIIVIHHLNPITIEDLMNESSLLYDPENLISVTDRTHRNIHFSLEDQSGLPLFTVTRKPNDTCPWR